MSNAKQSLQSDRDPHHVQDSGGTVVLTLQNLAFGTGRVSARCDRGVGSQPKTAKVRVKIQFESAATVGEAVEVYLFESDGTQVDGTLAQRRGTYE